MATNPPNQTIIKKPGAAIGYEAAFEEAIAQIGQISPQEFVRRYASDAEYLPQITFDPTTSKFWDKFNFDIEADNKKHQGKRWRFDFCLNPEELAALKKNGFVVSDRMNAHTFADIFYRIYSNDLPIFLTADALLHAWHLSYSAMLEELEATYLLDSLREILKGMAEKLPEAWNCYGSNVLGLSLIDADYFLSVALSLIKGAVIPKSPDLVFKIFSEFKDILWEGNLKEEEDESEGELEKKVFKTYFKQDDRTAATLKAIKKEKLQEFKLFGRDRQIDFSQFKPRGHYENSQQLKQYFQTMMWCGRIDLRIADRSENSSTRELGAAIVLWDLLERSGKFEQWQQFDRLLQTFVGLADSMTFGQLGKILKEANIKSPADIKELATLEKLQADILAGEIGIKSLGSDYYVSPLGAEKADLPRTFTVLGQRFTLDSWAISKVVADQILWDNEKVLRFIPSSLDVTFAALGNSQVVPELASRMTNPEGREFRDGINYQHNLAAVKDVIDAQNQAIWEENIYTAWLATLRELSAPTTDPIYPEAMRTSAWAMKTVNTQLASWTQLRHDTILYAEQVYTLFAGCDYPAAFVEPRVSFWERFEKMANLAADRIENTPFPDRLVDAEDKRKQKKGVHFLEIQSKQAEFCKNFVQKLAVIKKIAAKQLAQEKFAEEEIKFLEEIVEIEKGSGYARYNGWYPQLFYKGEWECDKWDALVADVHTSVPVPELNHPGCVLHQGIGNVDMLIIAVDSGDDKIVYAGPTMSYYEFEMPGISRKSDEGWRDEDMSWKGSPPPRPEWTKSYLVTS